MLKKILPFISVLVFSSFLSIAQQRFNSSSSFKWSSDSTILFQLRGTNFGREKLIDATVNSLLYNSKEVFFSKDSIYIPKGISSFSADILVNNQRINPYKDTLVLQITLASSSKKGVTDTSSFILYPRTTTWATIDINDSSISISPSSNSTLDIAIHSSFAGDSSYLPLFFSCKADTVIPQSILIRNSPFQKRTFELIQKNQEGKEEKATFLYKKGVLAKLRQEKKSIKDSSSVLKPKDKAIQLSGNIGIESNYFSSTPQHSNGAQYPFTAIQASNTVSLFGLPFTLNASHSTNDNISPNFRNFFSFQFDVASYRNQIQQQLEEKKLASIYPSNDVLSDIEKNKNVINNLERTKELLYQYPNESINIDSVLSEELAQIAQSQRTDSLFQLDSLSYDSMPFDSANIDPSKLNDRYQQLDSSLTENERRIRKIQRNIDRLNRSNELKEKYLDDLKTNPPSTDEIPVSPNELFSKVEGSSFISTLLRFEKFELGNFYEFAGQYSIRDVEMRGVNTSFLINPKNKVSFLYGKINNFQSFNLDDIEENKRVMSFALQNSEVDFFKPSVRVTRYHDESVNPELSNTTSEYYVTSLNAEGDVGDFATYAIEVDQSNQELNPLEGLNDQEGKNRSYFFQSYFTPFSFLDIKLQFDQVGSAFQSDGVYFLNRNSQAYTAGVKLRLFKNKLHIKNDFNVLHRNFEQKSLTNKTQRQFYDVGTHFKRIPNIQVSYAPISVEVANQLDTSFSGIDANTNVLIARLFYIKKIKKTFLTTALVYNEIENELADNFSTQKGIQHFISISNEKTNFSFTSSYDKTFASVRFISTNVSHQFTDKFRSTVHLAKNFSDNFYSEIIRSGFSYQLLKQLNLGVGAIFLIEESNKSVNSGGSCSLRFTY